MLALFLLALAVIPAFTAFECGQLNPAKTGSARVVGGHATTYFKYPWFASIHQPYLMDHQTCAGALIAPNFVLTAAHCFDTGMKTPKRDFYHVTLGIFNQCQKNADAITYKILEVYVHPKFTKPENFYDIALMKLDGSSALMPVCLPAKGSPIKHLRQAEVVGFGRLDADNKTQPCELNEADVEIFTDEECRNKSDMPAEVLDQMVQLQTSFCAGKMEGGIDTCQGDSGGSILVKQNKRYFSMGIVSFGYGCAEKLEPGIYTNVASYIDWINKTMDGELRMYQEKASKDKKKAKAKKRPFVRRLLNFALG